MEIFNIDDIKDVSMVEGRAFVREGWDFPEAHRRNVLILSPKLGEISYNYLCAVTRTNGGKAWSIIRIIR